MTQRRLVTTFVATSAVLALAACSSATSSTTSSSTAPGTGSKAVGFIFVGPKTDFGYNQAAYEGSQEVAKKFPNLKVLTQENVPEDDNAARAMEGMISRGAKIIFATSYGHLQAAEKVAKAHPDVVVVQQGNVIDGAVPANLGTYFGTVYEPVFLAGVAAGKATKSNKLGYIYAFPIPQTINNINAFELGAQSVNPEAKTYAVNTGSWCDPQKQKTAVDSLLSQQIDVVTQHQDCTSTIIQATEAAGADTVGYHADAQSLAPKGWLTGSQWAWAPLYDDIVQTALDGKFTGSKYNANYRVGFQNGENPFVQSAFGPTVSAETKSLIAEDLTKLKVQGSSVFTGPIKDQDGAVKIKDGDSLAYGSAGIEGMDWFVDGVVGKIAK
ncbi:MAG TPA: BMP family ABC transporter substrate-binding protein [Kineosporiaceae bacterium]|nr:BMP family ABC transporter substrate-binding protein [Kineosporiaceae bacterium]